MGKNFVENLVVILYILEIASVHDRDAYFIEHVLISFRYLLRFEALNATKV